MRKLMLLASMLAMVLLAASPVLAQQGGTQNTSGQLCQNIVGDITVAAANDSNVEQGNEGDATATGGDAQYSAGGAQYGDGGDAAAAISDDDLAAVAQQNNVSVEVVQNCFQTAVQTGDIDVDDNGDVVAPEPDNGGGDNGGTGDDGTNGAVNNTSSQFCQNIVGDITVAAANTSNIEQGNQGDATATGGDAQYGDGGDAAAAISDDDVAQVAQENNVSVSVVQNCIQTAVQTGNIDVDENGAPVVPEQPAPQQPAPEAPAPEQQPAPDKEVVVVEKPAPDKEIVVEKPADKEITVVEKPAAQKQIVVEKPVPAEKEIVVQKPADKEIVVVEKPVVQKEVVVEEPADKEVVVTAAAEQPEAAPQQAASQQAAPQQEVAPQAPAEAEDETITVLPDTGGASLFTLGAGALLVGGGLLARRIVR